MKLTNRQVRVWLANYYQPGGLADPVIRDVLRAHGRPAEGDDFEVSKIARTFLREMVDRALLPRPEAPERIWRPYRALVLSHFEQRSHFTVARLLSVSSRQVSREMALAVDSLRRVLEKSRGSA